MKPLFSAAAFLAAALALSLAAQPALSQDAANPTTARGVVYNDTNGNRMRDGGEAGIPRALVSNGREVTATDAEGRYELPIDDDTILFVIKPRGWMTPLDARNLPRFYYIHKPAGSPDDDFEFPGVEPTGPLPASIDFPLVQREEPETFRVLVLGDPQPADAQDVHYYANDVIAELIGTEAAFAIAMGDLTGDDLDLFQPVNAVQAMLEMPVYNVHGNHDMNYEARDDKYADETFERVYGPANYAFQYGPVHFVILDNVHWQRSAPTETGGGGPVRLRAALGRYEGRLSEWQLEFLANYVALVPRSERIILCTHIPLPVLGVNPATQGTSQFRRVLEILSGHPLTSSFSAHLHANQHYFAGAADGYTPSEGTEHHHHNVATGSGSWFRGPLDEQGFPVTTMSDGVPNGSTLLTFTGTEYKELFLPARLPGHFQMAIHAPEVLQAGENADAEILVNVFNGSAKSTVRMRLRGAGDWVALEQTRRIDPAFAAMRERETAGQRGRRGRQGGGRPPLPTPLETPHMWTGRLGTELPVGFHELEVETTDQYGQTFTARKLLEVR